MATPAKPPLTDNEKAALLAIWAGVLMLLSGVTGASQWQRTFQFLQGVFGESLLLRFLQLVFVALGSVGGVFLFLGAYAFRNNKVRTGRLLIWFGTGFTIASLTLFLGLQARHGDLPYAGASILGLAGVMLSLVARVKARALPLKRGSAGADR